MRITAFAVLWAMLSVQSAPAQDAPDPTPPKDDVTRFIHLPPAGGTSVTTGLPATGCAKCHAGANVNSFKPNVAAGDTSPEFSYFLYHLGARQKKGLAASLTEPDKTSRAILKLPEDTGIVVENVCPKHKEGRMGLEKNDIILAVNGKPASSSEAVRKETAADEVVIKVLRKGKEVELKPEAKKAKKTIQKTYLLGIHLGELEPVVRTQLDLSDEVAVVILNVNEESAAKEAGIQPNDILVQINGKPASDSKMVKQAVQESKGKTVVLKLLRDSEELTLSIKPKLIETEVADALSDFDKAFTQDWYHFNYQLPKNGQRVPSTWYYNYGVAQPHWPTASPPDSQKLQKKLNEIDAKLEELKAVIGELKKLKEKSSGSPVKN